MEIRTPIRTEWKDCENVLRAAFRPFARRLGRDLENNTFSDLQWSAASLHLLVAVDRFSIDGVAVCSTGKETWVIDQVAVSPTEQGKGIGGALLQRVERDARGLGASVLELNTPEIMTDLLRLYHRHGFLAVRKGLPAHGRDQFTRVYMQKAI